MAAFLPATGFVAADENGNGDEDDGVPNLFNLLAGLDALGLLFEEDNPWLNPGFEAAIPSTGAAPPTYVTTTGGTSPIPSSSFTVVSGEGNPGNALRIVYDEDDTGRSLSIGQFLGQENLDGVWYGADGISFDWRGDASIEFVMTQYYYGPDGEQDYSRSIAYVTPSEEYVTVTGSWDVPSNAKLTTTLIAIHPYGNDALADGSEIFFDNVRITGSTFQDAPLQLPTTGNPWLNPGHDFTTMMEVDTGRSPDAEGQVKMVAPPTYLQATQGEESKLPVSNHSVAQGAGNPGNALHVAYSALDKDRALSLGQHLGNQAVPGGWIGADGISFDWRGDADTRFVMTQYYHLPDGTSGFDRHFSPVFDGDGEWKSVRADWDEIPSDAKLGVSLVRIIADEDADMYFDNFEVTGSTFAAAPPKSDLSDGYAMIIEPFGTAGIGPTPVLNHLETGIGDAFLVSAAVRDFTGAEASWVDLKNDATGQAFAVLNSDYVTGGLDMQSMDLTLTHPFAVKADDHSQVVFAIDPETAFEHADTQGLAALWSWFRLGDAYDLPIPGVQSQPASGYYSAIKNAVQDFPIADALDYAATFVSFEDASAGPADGLSQVSLSFNEWTTGPGQEMFTVDVDYAPTGWITYATLSVTDQDDVVLRLNGSGDTVHVDYEGAVPEDVVISITGTVFTRPAFISFASPIADLRVCEAVAGCAVDLDEILTLSPVHFDASGSADPAGLPITEYHWDFGDGSTSLGQTVTHVYDEPGTYTAVLTVTSEGGSSTAQHTFDVLNRAPIASIDAPSTITRLTAVAFDVTATDPDGEVDEVSASLLDGNGGTVASWSTAGDTLPVVIPLATLANLDLGTYTVEATAVDNLGAVSDVASHALNLVNVPPQVSLDLVSAALLGVGDQAKVNASWFSPDGSAINPVDVTIDWGDGSAPEQANLGNNTYAYGASGLYEVTLTVVDEDGGEGSASVLVTVDSELPEIDATVPGTTTGWYTGPVGVTLDVTNPGPSDVTGFYQVTPQGESPDGNAFVPFEDTVTVTLGGDGLHTLHHKAVDAAGNEGGVGQVDVAIDATAPELNDTLPSDNSVVSGTVVLSGEALDGLSGVDTVRLLIDDNEVASTAAGGQSAANVSFEWNTTAEGAIAMRDVTLEATDVAGNVNRTTVTVFVVNLPLSLPVIDIDFAGSAQNNGNNTLGLPTTGGSGGSVRIDPTGSDPVAVTLPDPVGTATGLAAYAGLMTDLLLADDGADGNAGIWGSASAAGAACAFQTWGGDTVSGNEATVGDHNVSDYEPRVDCNLV